MLTPETTQAAQTSYARLRLSARSNDDVAGWYAQHPDFIPNLPELLKPYLQLRIVTEKSMFAYKEEGKGIRQNITLDYTAALPNLHAVSTDATEIEKLLGQKIESDSILAEPLKISGRFCLQLDPADWPYVMAELVLVAADKDRSVTSLYRSLAKLEWSRGYPDVAWSTVEAMFDGGVMPNTTEGMADWLTGLLQTKTQSAELPEDLVPTTITM